jgi:cbb3-type cytochrome oxidase subunit 3
MGTQDWLAVGLAAYWGTITFGWVYLLGTVWVDRPR